MNIEQKIEGILFWKGEGVSIKKLTNILNVTVDDIEIALNNLKNTLETRGIVLMQNQDEVLLGTHQELSKTIEDLQKEELNKTLSKASLETLSIILYKNGATRAEIDYIRGVNSTFTLRALSVRGLIEKVIDPQDSRKFIWQPTFDLLSFMGISNINELPEYQNIQNSIENAQETLIDSEVTPMDNE